MMQDGSVKIVEIIGNGVDLIFDACRIHRHLAIECGSRSERRYARTFEPTLWIFHRHRIMHYHRCALL